MFSELLNSFILFFNNIISFKIIDNISILDIILYVTILSGILSFIYIAVKGRSF